MGEKNQKSYDAVYSESLITLMDALNDLQIKKEDIVQIFSDSKVYIAVFYN